MVKAKRVLLVAVASLAIVLGSSVSGLLLFDLARAQGVHCSAGNPGEMHRCLTRMIVAGSSAEDIAKELVSMSFERTKEVGVQKYIYGSLLSEFRSVVTVTADDDLLSVTSAHDFRLTRQGDDCVVESLSRWQRDVVEDSMICQQFADGQNFAEVSQAPRAGSTVRLLQ